jgi:glucose dehydrogenase
MTQEAELSKHYYLDASDSDIVALRRDDGTFVAAFSVGGATKEGLVEAAQEDYWALITQPA